MIYKHFFRDIKDQNPAMQGDIQEQIDTLGRRLSSGIDGTLKIKGIDKGWTMSNVTEDKVLDADSTSTAEIADVLGTLIQKLIAVGLISN